MWELKIYYAHLLGVICVMTTLMEVLIVSQNTKNYQVICGS